MKKRRTPTSRAGKPTVPTTTAKPAATRKGWGAAPILAIGLLVVGAAVFFVAAFEDTTVESGLQPASDLSAAAYDLGNQAAKPFPYYDSVEEARPFPVTLPPATYENETLQTTYAIAKEIPEVLVQLPCLCGCHGASEDHGSLLDCYVDNHAATWSTCLQEVLLAKEMHDDGASPEEIREAIYEHEFTDIPLR